MVQAKYPPITYAYNDPDFNVVGHTSSIHGEGKLQSYNKHFATT